MLHSPYEYFRAAFRYALDNAPHGTQAMVAASLGKSRIHINDILGGRANASQNLQTQIAQALGLDYIDMLTLGRNLLEGKSPPPAPDSSIPPDILEAVKDERMHEPIRAISRLLKEK